MTKTRATAWAAGLILVMTGWQAAEAKGPLPASWHVDRSLYPRAYGVLANGRLMCPVDMGGWPVKIDSSRQLFVDDYLVASTDGITRQDHQAKKHPGNPLVRTKDGQRWSKAGRGAHRIIKRRRDYSIVRPPLPKGVKGKLEEHFRDDREKDPARRFKALMLLYPNDPREGFFLYTSPDGRKWKRDRLEPVIPHHVDYAMPMSGIGDTSRFRWDQRLGKFVGDVKLVLPGIMRCRGIMFSDDLIHWTRPRMTLYPDALDDPDTQIYSHVGFLYESLWLGLARVMHTERDPASYKQTAIELTVSRDGLHWSRAAARKEIIPLGKPGQWDAHYQTPYLPAVVGDEIRMYYTSRTLWKDRKRPTARGMGLATLRRDGFTSLNAGLQGGTVVTRPLTFEGKTLRINAEIAPGGRLRSELRTAGGAAVDPYTLANCIPVTGNVMQARIVWGNRKTIEHSPTSSLRLVFELKNTKLYSFWIE